MKKIFVSCFLGALALSASALEETITFTYAGEPEYSWGKEKSQIYDVAMRINDPMLVGKKITSIRALISADEGVESTSLWLSKELKLEKVDGVKLNVPDAFSADVTVEKTTIPATGETVGELSVKLDTPCEIPSQGMYVGYTLSVPKAPEGGELTEMQKKPLLLSKSGYPDSFYLRLSKDFVNWTPYNSKLAAAPLIYVTIEGDFDEYNVSLNSLYRTRAAAGEPFTVKGVISTYGIVPVSQIGYAYSIAGKDYEATYDLPSPLEPNFLGANSSVVELPIAAVEEAGDYMLDLKITTVNGGANVNNSASAVTPVTVLPFLPVHRPMLEEFTGTWCGWCTRGYIALEELNRIYGDNVVLAAYHNGDSMAVQEYPVSFGGAPSAVLNRGPVEDPYFGVESTTSAGFLMKSEVQAIIDTPVSAAIDVTAVWEDASQRYISVNAVSKFLEDKADAGYKVGFLLINSGLSGTGISWIQNNYYYDYGSALNGTPLEVLTTWPEKVPGLEFNDVVVDVEGMRGVDGSLPADITYNTPYATPFSFDITLNTIIQDKEKLYVAAFIINPDGTILNSCKAKVTDGSYVGTLDSEAVEVSAEYYNLSGVRVANPDNGIFLKVSKLSDGTTRTRKIAK